MIEVLSPASNDEEYQSFVKVKERFAAGEIIVYGRPDLLLIDLDSLLEMQEFSRRLVIFEGIYGQLQKFKVASPSGRGWHVYVNLKGKQSKEARIAMQAALGSDIKRDLLSLEFVIHPNGDVNDAEDFFTNPIFLFEKDPSDYPEWVISKESIQKQRIQQVKLIAEKYGLLATVEAKKELPPRIVDTPAADVLF